MLIGSFRMKWRNFYEMGGEVYTSPHLRMSPSCHFKGGLLVYIRNIFYLQKTKYFASRRLRSSFSLRDRPESPET